MGYIGQRCIKYVLVPIARDRGEDDEHVRPAPVQGEDTLLPHLCTALLRGENKENKGEDWGFHDDFHVGIFRKFILSFCKNCSQNFFIFS